MAPRIKSNLDIYLFKKGADLTTLSNNTYSVADNNGFQVQPLIYTITETNTYYVQVKEA